MLNRNIKHRTKFAKLGLAALVQCFLGSWQAGFGQGWNDLWLGGFDSDGPPPFGGVDLEFITGSLVISTVSRDIGFRRTSANITDANGDLLFSTNGAFVANAFGDTMLNGTGLSPGWYADQYTEGFAIPQGVLVLPKPEAPDIYYLFHNSVDVWAGPHAQSLYLTTIDMSLDGGLGGVTSKNQVIFSDDLNVGRLTAVRHANGRDWWVFCHKLDTNIYYRLLVTPSGITIDGTQAIGAIREADAGQVCFSPDGSKFAYYWGDEPGDDLDILSFDRCTGHFFDVINVQISDYDGGGGVAFSPNGRYVYVSSVFDVYQFDTEAADVAASMVHIAEWDSTYSPFPPLATLFDIAQLAPDGKIYISTGNSTDKLHVIHSPDSAGLACNIEQHGIALPRYFSNSLPNHPNYHLGPIDGSVCDSLGINAGMLEEALRLGVQAYPNPSAGNFTLSYPAQSTVGELEVRDLSGRLLLRERIPQWSQLHSVELHEAAGMYQCRIVWGTQRAAVRVILEP
ncbi:MAG: T9SS type A sorting domain-containing protein [Flavobacteriales bacterium]|nr:T9SS type A sorting domain-containing protein [Flavobacteriales bacterium]MBK7943757.1 T9SS type A sorting domain-containing protein [Flavobacteriales bacterium]MBK9699562.1 T9SS type A sorting domain-containing protein [Flavobacteriales bacterium]